MNGQHAICTGVQQIQAQVRGLRLLIFTMLLKEIGGESMKIG
jgi:hypothetical protein